MNVNWLSEHWRSRKETKSRRTAGWQESERSAYIPTDQLVVVDHARAEAERKAGIPFRPIVAFGTSGLARIRREQDEHGLSALVTELDDRDRVRPRNGKPPPLRVQGYGWRRIMVTHDATVLYTAGEVRPSHDRQAAAQVDQPWMTVETDDVITNGHECAGWFCNGCTGDRRHRRQVDHANHGICSIVLLTSQHEPIVSRECSGVDFK